MMPTLTTKVGRVDRRQRGWPCADAWEWTEAI